MKKKELKREIDSLKENFEQMAKENQILKEEILKLNKEIDYAKVFKNNSIKFYKNFLENPNLSCLERNDILSLININTPHDILSFTFCENFEKKSVFKADLEKEQINAQKLLLEKEYPGTFHRDKNEFDFMMVKFKDEAFLTFDLFVDDVYKKKFEEFVSGTLYKLAATYGVTPMLSAAIDEFLDDIVIFDFRHQKYGKIVYTCFETKINTQEFGKFVQDGMYKLFPNCDSSIYHLTSAYGISTGHIIISSTI